VPAADQCGLPATTPEALAAYQRSEIKKRWPIIRALSINASAEGSCGSSEKTSK
jgi:hypothetical protein